MGTSPIDTSKKTRNVFMRYMEWFTIRLTYDSLYNEALSSRANDTATLQVSFFPQLAHTMTLSWQRNKLQLKTKLKILQWVFSFVCTNLISKLEKSQISDHMV